MMLERSRLTELFATPMPELTQVAQIGIETLEMDFLADELECQVHPKPHESSVLNLPPCSVEVTHIVGALCLGADGLGMSCNAIAQWMIGWMAQGGICGHCKNPIKQCWSVRPI